MIIIQNGKAGIIIDGYTISTKESYIRTLFEAVSIEEIGISEGFPERALANRLIEWLPGAKIVSDNGPVADENMIY